MAPGSPPTPRLSRKVLLFAAIVDFLLLLTGVLLYLVYRNLWLLIGAAVLSASLISGLVLGQVLGGSRGPRS